jgi:hypothetical protein
MKDYMTQGELEYAIRKAQNHFDEWNDVTGVPAKSCSWYYEILSLIEDAVKIGAKVACEGINADLSDILED